MRKALLALLVALICPATGILRADSYTLTWTAPGDDGSTGVATRYDLRYSTTFITSDLWALATPVVNMSSPQPAGTRESFTVDGLDPNLTYYFALRTCDETGNWSGLSNVARRAVCPEECVGIRGNIDGDPDELIDIRDLVYMVNLFFGHPAWPLPACPMEANVNGDTEERIDIGDLVYMVEYFYGTPIGAAPAPCF